MEMVYEIHGAAFRYPKGEKDVFCDVSLTLAAGQVLCILGPNGAGKSTLLNCMAALEKPHTGQLMLGGKLLQEQSPRQIARMVGYVQQNNSPAFSYPVYQYVLMGRAPHLRFFARPGPADEALAWDALEQLGIVHLANKPYTEISGGERQQCVIARALVQQPRVLLFDEPTAHLDFGNQARILQLIKQLSCRGYAVVMTTHNPDHALLLDDQVAILDKSGHLRQGAARDVLTQEALQQMYHTDLRLLYIEELARKACLLAGIEGQTSTQKEDDPL